MVLEPLKLAFVHIPKTAGRSIETCLGHRRLSNREPQWHASAAQYGHFIEMGFRTFTVVRNPWDRLVSLNHHITGHGKVVPMTALLDMIENRTRRAHFLCPTQKLWFNAPIDRVLRYEDLADGWRRLCEDFELSPEELPHRNRARHRLADYREYYRDGEAERVERICSWEIERFGYRF